MTSHNELSDQVFLTAFQTATLPPALFNHEAHLRLAWLHLEVAALPEAIAQVQAAIQHYVAQLGASDKYHDTLTVAAVYVVQHFRQRLPDASFRELLTAFPRLTTDFKGVLHSHYTEDALWSTAARVAYLPPNILEFS